MKSTTQQIRRFHAMVDDIARQVRFCGRKWKSESWKRLLIAAWVNIERDDAYARGDPDPFPGPSMVLVGLDGDSVVHLGEQVRKLTRAQLSNLIEAAAAYGAENNVFWSDKTKKAEGEDESI